MPAPARLIVLLACLALPRVAAAAYQSPLSNGTLPPAPALYRATMENFRRNHVRAVFPLAPAAIAESYVRFSPRDIFSALETYSLLEVVNGADASHPLDAGPAMAGDREARLRDLVKWELWLLSREGPSHQLNNPAANGTPWLEGRLRGWGSKNFNNGTSDFRGWHTYAEQTSVPLIGMFQTVMALDQWIREDPTRAGRRVFNDAAFAAVSASGYLALVTPTLADERALEVCTARPDACRYDLRPLTFGQAAVLLRDAGGAILDWWIAHGTTAHGAARMFWYTARGDSEFAGSGVATRNLFVVHENMLMGRAAFLYGLLRNDTRYFSLAASLHQLFLAAHHACSDGEAEVTCYHYAVLGKPLAPLAVSQTYGSAAPERVWARPSNLEEPFHMNGSHALVGLMNGRSFFNHTDFVDGDSGWLTLIQDTFRKVYVLPLPQGDCRGFTPFQCTHAFAAGPPAAQARLGKWTIVPDPALFPLAAVTDAAGTFMAPDYQRGEAVAAYYLTEGADDETFRLLYEWWDAYGRRTQMGCEPALCPNPFAGSNFPKMGAYLAASLVERGSLPAPRLAPALPGPRRGGGCGQAPVQAVLALGLLRLRRRKDERPRTC